MDKILMLVFLSDVKINDAGKVIDTEYKDVGKVHTTNESAVRYLFAQEGKLDHVFMFVSGRVQNYMTYKDTEEKTKEYLDETGSRISHMDYFKKRIGDIFPSEESNYTQVGFDENSTPAESMKCVLDMAEKIQAYVDSFPTDTDIVLHADCTGGLRHANMMMMAVLRILQYNGVKIGRVLYSNYHRKVVEEANPIYELFDFVSGAEEFANFGSANAINHYFDRREQPKVLADLLKAMDFFSDEIRLCHRRGLMKAAENLKKSIENFEKDNEENLNIRLVRQLKARIKKDYSSLLEKDFSVLNLIKWCLEHDYLQQALTLYVEGVPDYLYEKRFFQPTDDMEKRKIIHDANSKQNEYSEGFFNLVVFRPPNGNNLTNIMQSKGGKATKKVINVMKEYVPTKKSKGNPIDIDRLLGEIGEILNNNEYICLNYPEKVKSCFSSLEHWRTDPEQLVSSDEHSSFADYLKSQVPLKPEDSAREYCQRICSHILSMKEKEFEKYITGCKVEYAYDFISLCEPEQNYFRLNVPTNSMRQILNVYGYFKGERNVSNHARKDDDVITADELKEKMNKAVNYIVEAEKKAGL